MLRRNFALGVGTCIVDARRFAVYLRKQNRPHHYRFHEKTAVVRRVLEDLRCDRFVDELLLQIASTDVERTTSETLQSISEADVRAILAGLAEQFEEADREGLKDFLAGLVERIDLTADGSRCVIHYRISTGDKLASPRRAGLIPVLRISRTLWCRG
ncbi:MAG: hypothetical protein IT529_01005 [Burkholderiales bacterium]|nr:hypothetical protein [Burkholderiales bacterium]